MRCALLCLFVAQIVAGQSVLSVFSSSAPVLASNVHSVLRAASLNVSTFDLGAGAVPTLSQLRAHSSVFVWLNWGMGAAQSEAVGDVLADFVDGGGSLIVSMWGFSGATTRIRGRLLSDGMLPVEPLAEASGTPATLVKLLPSHRLLENVRSFSGGANSWRTQCTVAADAVLVAQWSTGEPLVLVTEKFAGTVVVLGMFAPSSAVGFGLWNDTTDGGQLMANAISYRRGVSSSPSTTTTTTTTTSVESDAPQPLDVDDHSKTALTIALALVAAVCGIAVAILVWRRWRTQIAAQNIHLSDKRKPSPSRPRSRYDSIGSDTGSHSDTDGNSSSLLSVVPVVEE
jgi:hypothetical protein